MRSYRENKQKEAQERQRLSQLKSSKNTTKKDRERGRRKKQ